MINKCIEFCNNYKAPIRCRYLAYELVDYDKDKIRDQLFRKVFIDNKEGLIKYIQRHISIVEHEGTIGYENDVKCNNYEDIDKYIIELKKSRHIIEKYSNELKHYNHMFLIYNNLKSLGSDDNDEQRVKIYELIGRNFNKLYESGIDYI